MIWATVALLAFALLAWWGAKRYRFYREQRDLRIRYERLSRFCIIPQKGTRSVFSHNPEDL
jgi:hypothetical protein